MSDSEASVVGLGSAEEDRDILYVRLCSPSNPPILVCAPAAWLARVPYFATQLAEPWNEPSPQQQIALECTPGSSPEDYLECLRLLSSSPTSWPSLLASVNKVLRILPVADHLLFQDCWDTCMAVLASSPWSIEEEDVIRATISDLNMEPSLDVKERLDTSHDGVVLEALFSEMVSTSSLEASFSSWCQKCLNHDSAPFAAAFHRILLEAVESLSAAAGAPKQSLPREWYVLANIILKFTDAQQFILHLVNSEDLLKELKASIFSIQSRNYGGRNILKQVLQKVDKRVVLLSNLQRERLVKLSKEVFPERGFFIIWRGLAETLPFSNATRISVMKSMVDVVPQWADQVSHRVSQMDETGLKAVWEDFKNSRASK